VTDTRADVAGAREITYRGGLPGSFRHDLLGLRTWVSMAAEDLVRLAGLDPARFELTGPVAVTFRACHLAVASAEPGGERGMWPWDPDGDDPWPERADVLLVDLHAWARKTAED
jgi:hypothetical protein